MRKLYKFDPLLEGLLALALVTVVLQRMLRTIPELFAGGAAIGDVFSALALSYTGAWFFNLLVIRLPRQRDKIAVVTGSGNLIARYAGLVVGILDTMASRNGHLAPPRQPDEAYLARLFADVRPGAAAPMQSIDGVVYNWVQFAADSVERAANIKTRLSSLFPYLDAETVSAVAAVENCTLYQLLPQHATLPVGNPDMLAFLELYLELWEACAHVGDRYLLEISPLLEPKLRLELDSPHKPIGST